MYLYQSTLDIFGGTITGGKVTGKGGGAIALDDSKCVLNIYGGEISGNNGNKSGGAIFLNKTDNKGGTVNMYGGTIANNTAQKRRRDLFRMRRHDQSGRRHDLWQ